MSIVIVLILLLSIDSYNYVYWFISISIIFLLLLFYVIKQVSFNPLTILVVTFISLLMLNMIFVSPIDNAEADYMIWLFAGGFLLFTYADKKNIDFTFYSLIGLFLLLSVWGLIQYTTGNAYLIDMGHRANSIFITPNTFAASINIILLPLIIFYVLSHRFKYLLAVVVLLFSALLVTQSRGGWVAFVSSLVFISILSKVLNIKFDKIRFKKLMIGLTIVIVTYSAVNLADYDRLNNDYSINEDINYLIRSDSIEGTMSQRIELFDIAWRRIKQKPIRGHGLHTYQHYEPRDYKSPLNNKVTRYVHNDYLQLWMETGILGVLLFVMLFIVLIYLLIKLSNKVSDREKIIMLAIISGLASFYVHALVDFVFYVPFLLLIFACSLGLFNQIVNKYYQHAYVMNISSMFIRFNLLKLFAGLFVLFILSQPAIAQLAYGEAVRRTNQLNIEGALPLYELARQFAPYEPNYYWYEGAVLMNAVKIGKHKLSAKRADELFSKGMAVSPYATNNRLARVELHRDYAYLLDNPEELNVVLSWNEEALYWRPYDPVNRAEYLKTLIAMGENDKATTLLDNYILQNPESEKLLEIKQTLEKNG